MKTRTTLTFVTLSALCLFYFGYSGRSPDDGIVAMGGGELSVPLSTGTSLSVNPAERSSEAPEATKSCKRFITASRGGRIKGTEGTVLQFGPNSFVDATGLPVAGRIRIELEECYDLSSILNAKLSTTSGKDMIETAGMVNVKAFAGRDEVFLAPGKYYEIGFPRNGNINDDFRLFYGKWQDDGIIDWRLASDVDGDSDLEDDVDSDLRSISSTSTDCFIQITESQLRRGTRISNMDYFNWQLRTGQSLNQWFLENFNPDMKMLSDYCSNALRTEITFHVDREGKFLSYYISESSVLEYDRQIAAFIATMPSLNLDVLMPSYTDDHACVLTFSSRQMEAAEAVVASFRKQQTQDKPMIGVKTSELDYYVFASSELGWINCDRFLPEEDVLVNMHIEAQGGTDAMVCMVFDEMRSVLKGKYDGERFLFEGIPGDEKVRIIAIDNATGAPKISVLNTLTAEGSKECINYKAATLSELDWCFKSTGPDVAAVR
jgi:hypothetical protein